MKTDELVSLLARDLQPVAAGAATHRIAIAAMAGFAGAALLMAWRLGLNPDLARVSVLPMFWVKVAFVAAVLAVTLPAVRALATPGARVAAPAVAAPFLALWLIALIVLARAAPADRVDLVLGATWRSCPFNIAMLSVPAFAASLWALKGLAPTRLRLAGAGAGLFSAAIGTLLYTLHCPEIAPPFVGVWYVLGMAIPTAFGALLGPRVLRW